MLLGENLRNTNVFVLKISLLALKKRKKKPQDPHLKINTILGKIIQYTCFFITRKLYWNSIAPVYISVDDITFYWKGYYSQSISCL